MPVHRALLVSVVCTVLLLVACSGERPTVAPVEEAPARLALEPGDDPAIVADIPPPTVALPGQNDLDDDPSEALVSTEAVPDAAASDQDVEANGGDDPPVSEPDETPAGVTTLDALIDELVPFVEEQRGLQFATPPLVEPLGPEAFSAAAADRTERDLARFADRLAEQTTVYRALGILTPEQDLASVFRSFGDAGITAFHDAETGVVYVRDEPITPLLRTALVHELARALDHQEFGTVRLTGAPEAAELAWTRAALAHGSAEWVADRYRERMTPDELAEEQAQIEALPRSVSLALFTNAFLELQFGRPFYGELAAGDLWADGQAALDAALAAPPETSEALITGAASAAVDVPDPTAEGPVVARGVWGQAGLLALFSELLDPDEAEAASTGWGGDEWVAWEAGTASCVRLHMAADSPEDLDRHAELLAEWAELGDRQLFFPTADLIRITACS